MQIAAGQFKAQCLKLMEEVRTRHQRIVITKRGRPVAMVVPVDPQESKPLFGFLKGTVVSQGDLIDPVGEKWDAGE